MSPSLNSMASSLPFSNLPTLNPLSVARMAGFFSRHGFKISDTPSLVEKVVVITGGQAGIGREITAQLLLHGVAKVYILARSEGKYLDSKKEWIEGGRMKQSDVEGRTEFVRCDLSDMHAVYVAVDVLLSKLDRLDILICNAALPIIPKYNLSPQNIETVFACNHLGHFVLTNRLLPILERTAATFGDVRIVVTTSSLHLSCQSLDLSQLTSSKPVKSLASVDAVWRYARSKLANVLFTRELAQRLEKKGSQNMYANCYFPGNIPTDAMETWKDLIGNLGGTLFKGVFQLGGQTPVEAATTALYLSASGTIKRDNIKGRYFVPIATEEKSSTTAEDLNLAKNLWDWSYEQASQTLGTNWAAAI